MPTTDGALSVEEIQQVAEAINVRAKTPDDPCPNCGKTPSVVLPYLSKIDLGYHEGLPRLIPVAATICTKCGLTRMFSADILGIETPSNLALLRFGEAQSDG